MTCIAAVVKDGIGYIAGERSASNMSSIMPIAEPKIWKYGEYLFGYYGSFAGEKIKYNFSPTPVGDNDLATFMNSTFLSELHETFETINLGSQEDLELIVVVNGKIFIFNAEDFSITMYISDYMAKGSGGEYAMGSLWTTLQAGIEPDVAIRLAVEAAIEFSPTCCGPIDIERVG